jgi:predicted transglutaminase-like cysteine proteinase
MTSIFDYIYSIDGISLDSSGAGICVFPLCTGDGSGTCGCVGLATMPALTGDGTADWAPLSVCTLPALDSTGTDTGYHPAWGDPELSAISSDGTAHVLIESVGLLPPLFAAGQTGTTAEVSIRPLTCYALDDSFNCTASGAGSLSALTAEGISCGIYKPIDNSASSSSVVALLQQGNIPIADATVALTNGLTTSDAIAATIVRYVASNLSYVSDGDGYGDTWTCALATYRRGYGDCEDGAILIQSLLLAAGVDPNRIMTCFGTVLSDETSVGHAWTIYRRESDNEWVPLEWTDAAFQTLSSVNDIKRMVDRTAVYTAVAYILTSTAFTATTTANWLLRITTLRSTAAVTMPGGISTGQTNISCKGAATIPAVTATARAGLRPSLALPKLTATATARQISRSAGACTLPAPITTGRTGAHGDGAFPKLQAVGATGANGSVWLHPLTTDTSAKARAFVDATLIAPRPRASGHALVGAVVMGECVAPLPVVHATDLPSLTAHGVVRAPVPRMAATAAIVSLGTADLFAPLPVIFGQAHGIPAWTTSLLQYDPTRLA